VIDSNGMETNHTKRYKDKGKDYKDKEKDCKTSSSHCSEGFYRISSLSIRFRPIRDGFFANVQVQTWNLE
jgi:hypothetical protein